MKKFLSSNWLYVLMIMQPLLDMFYYFQKVNSMTPITWVIRLALLGITFLITFFSSNKKKKLVLMILPFLLFYLVHILNLYRIHSLNFIDDTKYFLYVFQLPVLVILLIDYISNNKDKIKVIEKSIFINFIIVAVGLLLAVLTNTEQCTYELNGTCIGLLGWFAPSDTVFLILCAIVPWAMHYSYKNHGGILYALITGISFLILYTNASKSCYYTLILMSFVIIYNCIFSKTVRSQKTKLVFTILLLTVSLYTYSSSFTFYRHELDQNNIIEDQKIIQETLDLEKKLDKDSLEYKSEFIQALSKSYIYREIIEIHGEDAVIKAMNGKLTAKTLSDNRLRKIINARIEKNNSDELTHFLGFGYSKVNAYEMDLENDIHAVYFFYGYIGFALYLIYIIYFIYLIVKVFIKNPKAILDSDFVFLSFIFALLVFAGEYTGAFLRKPNSNLYLVMYLAMLYFKCNELILIEKENYNKYLNVVYKKSKKSFYTSLNKILDSGEKKFIITANPETIVYATKDSLVNDMLFDSSNLIVPDGIAIVKAAKILKIDIKERISGIDIAEHLLEIANNKKKSLYLFGAKEEVVKKLVEIIKYKYPKIKVLGYTNGYIDNKDEEMKRIISLKPDICLVALGIPGQEKLIYNNISLIKKGIYMGVGGSFDVMSGIKKRAPKIFIKMNLEWLYRICKEPKRLKRFFNNNIKFLYKVFQSK